MHPLGGAGTAETGAALRAGKEMECRPWTRPPPMIPARNRAENTSRKRAVAGEDRKEGF